MKILLDECLPIDFRHSFVGYEAHTVQYAGLKSKKNGELMRLAEELGYAVIVTVDQGIPFQQPMRGRKISLLVIRSKSNQLEDLLPFVDAAILVIETIAEGTLNFIPSV